MKRGNIQRLSSGMRKMKEKKILILIPVIYVAAMIFLLFMISNEIIQKTGEQYSQRIFEIALYVFIVELIIVGVIGIIQMLGKPLASKRIEGKLIDVGFVDNEGDSPMLLSKRRDNNGFIYEFYSPSIPLTRYENHIIESVKDALKQEKEYQRLAGIKCTARVDGFTDFIFVNRFGNVQHQGTLNKALRRIIRDCNQEVLDKAGNNKNVILLPKFSCHTLRHTFTTRLCESGINIKVIQSVLGHSDISTTLDIYADVTRDLKRAEMEHFDDFMKKKGYF